jgi:hypothetical protein
VGLTSRYRKVVRTRWKGVQFDIGWHFVANPNLVGAGHLLDVHVLKIFFYDVILLC